MLLASCRVLLLFAASLALIALFLPLASATLSRLDALAITDVHVVFSNHLDVGFDGITPVLGTAANVIDRYLNTYVPRALETAKNVSRDTQGKQQYTWMTQWSVS